MTAVPGGSRGRLPNGPADNAKSRRRRLSPEIRSEMILVHAVTFFAEHGFDGQLKDLAEQADISQALIFSYFGSKQALIERVYEKVFTARWKEIWYDTLVDRSKPLDQRLREYYGDYLRAIDEPVWIRIVFHSGLSGNELTSRYVSHLVDKLLKAIVAEVYDTFGFTEGTFPEADLYEIVWDLQASFLYGLVRKHIWKLPVMPDVERLVEQRVRQFTGGLQLRASQRSGAASRPRTAGGVAARDAGSGAGRSRA